MPRTRNSAFDAATLVTMGAQLQAQQSQASATAVLDPPADVAVLDPPCDTEADATTVPTRVPCVGDTVHLYYADESRPLNATARAAFALASEEATITRVHSSSDPRSMVDLRIDSEEVGDYFRADAKITIGVARSIAHDSRLLRRWGALDPDGAPVQPRDLPPTMPPVGCTDVCVWLPSREGPKPIRGRVVADYPNEDSTRLTIATPDHRLELRVPSAGRWPTTRTWSWPPAEIPAEAAVVVDTLAAEEAGS